MSIGNNRAKSDKFQIIMELPSNLIWFIERSYQFCSMHTKQQHGKQRTEERNYGKKLFVNGFQRAWKMNHMQHKNRVWLMEINREDKNGTRIKWNRKKKPAGKCHANVLINHQIRLFLLLAYLVFKWMWKTQFYTYIRRAHRTLARNGAECGAKSTVINLFVFGASHKMNIIIARGSLPNFIHDQFNWLLHVLCSFLFPWLVCCVVDVW